MQQNVKKVGVFEGERAAGREEEKKDRAIAEDDE